MSTLSQRQVATLQQMGITPYQVPARPIELCILSEDPDTLSHPLVQDVLALLSLSEEQVALAQEDTEVKAKRYWHMKHYLPASPSQLHSTVLAQLNQADAKRRLWQGLQRWL
ncbi:DNA polymerase III subunit psi [Ferrimonas marina]|uniref:DNA polymerase III, psi subunit n=1 Tax=Ferrimonas marina TaxID=299255 RepID=A0A1M5W0R6_9GAMM|nr:DNA polymerase III subunit psi [Ferrimonas marina]SHH81061.1 DNA polymerase III, psi subunit [Ferrimonas marina]